MAGKLSCAGRDPDWIDDASAAGNNWRAACRARCGNYCSPGCCRPARPTREGCSSHFRGQQRRK